MNCQHCLQWLVKTWLHRPGGAVSLAVGMAHIFSRLPNMDHLMGYWYHFCIMFEALFIMTLIDAGTRVGRYLLQELLGHFHPKFNDQHWAPGVYGCAALICILWGYLVLQGNIGIIWPLFGVSNPIIRYYDIGCKYYCYYATWPQTLCMGYRYSNVS